MSINGQVLTEGLVMMMYFFFIVLSVAREGKKKIGATQNLMFACYVVHSGAGLITDVLDYQRRSAEGQYICCILYTVSGFLALYYYGRYYIKTCEAKPEALKKLGRMNFAVLVLSLAATLPLIPSGLAFSITPECEYVRGDLFFLSYIFPIAELLFLSLYAIFAVTNRKKAIGYVIFGSLPMVTCALLLFLPIPSSVNDLAAVVACATLYLFISVEDREKVLKQEVQLQKYKTDVILSQIDPHFLYNTLNSIAALCGRDPKLAQKLTGQFSDYFRGNLDAIDATGLYTLEAELEHAKLYLEIEQVRFGNKLSVEYDIRARNFCLPPLTVQTLVENAVKHGIRKRAGCGTVTVRSWEEDEAFYLTVTDDGVGFDPAAVKDDGKPHRGLNLVETRLNYLCGGTLSVHSRIGEGTEVKVEIPKEKGNQV